MKTHLKLFNDNTIGGSFLDFKNKQEFINLIEEAYPTLTLKEVEEVLLDSLFFRVFPNGVKSKIPMKKETELFFIATIEEKNL